MTAIVRRYPTLIAALLAVVAACAVAWFAAFAPGSATGASISQLQSELGANSARASDLQAAVSALGAQVAKLDRQVALMQSRISAVQAELGADQAQLLHDQLAVQAQQAVIVKLKTRQALAEKVLAAELVSRYEQPNPTLVEIVLDAQGFQQLVDQLQDLKSADQAEQRIITVTRTAKAQALAAQQHLVALERGAAQATQAKQLQAQALVAMDSLLNSRRTSLAHVQAARTAALAAVRARGSKLTAALKRAQAQEAAAQAAAAAAAAAADSASSYSTSGTSSNGPWVIPTAIVMCESGGQNLPPNSAGASGYYQIIPSTWRAFGGTGPAAYLASKAEQDAVATRIYNGGKGVSNWDCAAIVGIT